MDNDERHRAYLADCCAAFGVELEAILGRRKTRAAVGTVRARKAIAWAMRQHFRDLSYPAIGRLLRRDHSTIMWAVETFTLALAADQDWAVDLASKIGVGPVTLAGLESPLESLRRCAGIDLSTAVELEAVGS